MAYIDVITLAQAKEYLRIDTDLTDDDAYITRVISSALRYVENWTSHIMFARSKDYLLVDGCRRVYDYPINSITTPTDVTAEEKTLYTNYEHDTESKLTLNIGYTDPADIPEELIDVALEIIDLLYYKNDVSKYLSPLSIDILNRYKRFLI